MPCTYLYIYIHVCFLVIILCVILEVGDLLKVFKGCVSERYRNVKNVHNVYHHQTLTPVHCAPQET